MCLALLKCKLKSKCSLEHYEIHMHRFLVIVDYYYDDDTVNIFNTI